MLARGVLLVAGAVTTSLLTLSACGDGGGEKSSDAEKKADAPVSVKVKVKVSDSDYGRILVDQSGRTLYAFTKDKVGKSSCDTSCIAAWPALTSNSDAKAGSGTQKSLLAKTGRTAGVSQVTYNEWPLYYYAGDSVAGDVNGQGVDGEWFAVSPDGKLIRKSLETVKR
jgi:predicted lipoprotein with Yx(FWY)xxD motif